MASTGEVWKLGHRPALDGLRAIAVVMVLWRHLRLPGFDGGTTGVTMFFTLSGFLITALLLEERDRFGSFSIPAFYRRRVRRLAPAMLACTALAVAAELVLTGGLADWRLVVGTLTYTSNFVMMGDMFPAYPTGLGHTWSLAVEEQFYLLWPLVMLGLVRLGRTRALVVLGLASVLPICLRAVTWDATEAGWGRVYFGLDMRADSILIGCALAFGLHGARRLPRHGWLAAAGMVALVIICRAAYVGPIWILTVTAPLAVGLVTAGVIYACVTGPGPRWLSSRPLVYLGRRSYGLYLYQGPVLLVVEVTLGYSVASSLLVALPATMILAELSWRLVERRWLHARHIGDGERGAIVGVGGAAADVRGDVEQVDERLEVVAGGELEDAGELAVSGDGAVGRDLVTAGLPGAVDREL